MLKTAKCTAILFIVTGGIMFVSVFDYNVQSGFGINANQTVEIQSESNIFFIESTKGDLTREQACSVEAAAVTNPEWTIYVLFLTFIENSAILTHLRLMKNVKLMTVDLLKFAEKSPLRRVMYRNPKLHDNPDILRFLLLYKFGGAVLDFDAVVVRPLRTLSPNWVVRIYNSDISTASMAISVNSEGREIINKALYYIIVHVSENEMDTDIIDNLRNEVMVKTVKDYCSVTSMMDVTLDKCPDLSIYDEAKLFPQTWDALTTIFQPQNINLGQAYIVHLKTPNSVLSRYINYHFPVLAQRYCPIIFKKYIYARRNVRKQLASELINEST